MRDEGAFARKLEEARRRFPANSDCMWRTGTPFLTALRTGGVPNEPGAYVLSACGPGRKQVAYIGRGGALRSNGTFSKQGMLHRLHAKSSSGGSRKREFMTRLREGGFDSLDIHWFVTWRATLRVMPSLLEAELMQAYVDEFGCLPPWNKLF